MILACVSADAVAGEDRVPRPRFYRPAVKEEVPDIAGYDSRANIIAAVDTYCIARFDFEAMNWQGWTQVDNTAQKGTFFHVDDFAGLSGGTRGMLVPLEGTKSLWCGVRPGTDPYLCSWETAPGYGNYWKQILFTSVMPHTGIVTLSYKYSIDTELENDYISVIFAPAYPAYEETEIARYYGRDSGVATHELFSASASFYLKFRFVSDGSDSDQDGLRDYDGAFIVDSITVSDENGLIDFEDFESLDVGETDHLGIWSARAGDAYGTYSGLANNLLDHDPCAVNLATAIVFFNGSPYPSLTYPFPGLFDTPFCKGQMGIIDPCQDEMVVSPWLDLQRFSSNCDENQDSDIPPGELGDMGGYMLSYSAYLDNPIENLVFHTWKIRNLEDGCPGLWLSDPLVRYYGDDGLWYRFEHDISGFVTGDSIQVAVGIVDMCSVWYGIFGDCAAHTPAPWFDSVKVSRYSVVGPQWAYQGADLFQDNFPSTDEMESYVRADMATDVSPPLYYDIVPGDSVVVTCWAPNAGGLDTLGTGEARVYFHCNVHFVAPDGKPDLFGPQLEGNYGTYMSDDGDWTVLLCEPARISTGTIAPDRYCIDLNDSLFTRGYFIEYYFKAYDLDGVSTTLPDNAETVSSYPYGTVSSYLFEFTCLPTLRAYNTVLFVDDFDGRGSFHGLVQNYLDPSLDAVTPTGEPLPERYDVNQPSAMAGNSLGSRARLAHLHLYYEAIVWDSGDLSEGTMISGSHESDKSDDIGLLTLWLDSLIYWRSGIFVMGDNIATDLSNYPDGLAMMNDWFGVTLEHSSYYEMTGGEDGGGTINALVTGVPGMSFDGEQFYLYGGCPGISSFDVLEKMENGIYALRYPDFGGNPYYAGVFGNRTNSQEVNTYNAWFGFSFMNIRNAVNGTLARTVFYNRVMRSWMVAGPATSVDYTDDEIPAVTALAGIFPNPFNPVTRVAFSLKKKGHVSMRIYDVSGRLVRVLVDEIREAGAYEVMWDGTNNGGRATASGIYFCRMEAADYQRTVKMVQLR